MSLTPPTDCYGNDEQKFRTWHRVSHPATNFGRPNLWYYISPHEKGRRKTKEIRGDRSRMARTGLSSPNRRLRICRTICATIYTQGTPQMLTILSGRGTPPVRSLCPSSFVLLTYFANLLFPHHFKDDWIKDGFDEKGKQRYVVVRKIFITVGLRELHLLMMKPKSKGGYERAWEELSDGSRCSRFSKNSLRHYWPNWLKEMTDAEKVIYGCSTCLDMDDVV